MNAQLINTAASRGFTKSEMRAHARKHFTMLRDNIVKDGIYPTDVWADKAHTQMVMELNAPINGDRYMVVAPMFNADFSVRKEDITPEVIYNNLIIRTTAGGWESTVEMADEELRKEFDHFGPTEAERNKMSPELKEKAGVIFGELLELTLRSYIR